MILLAINATQIKATCLIIAGLMVVAAAIYMIVKGLNGEIRESFKLFFIILIAALVIAVGSHLEELGNWLYGTLFS